MSIKALIKFNSTDAVQSNAINNSSNAAWRNISTYTPATIKNGTSNYSGSIYAPGTQKTYPIYNKHGKYVYQVDDGGTYYDKGSQVTLVGSQFTRDLYIKTGSGSNDNFTKIGNRLFEGGEKVYTIGDSHTRYKLLSGPLTLYEPSQTSSLIYTPIGNKLTFNQAELTYHTFSINDSAVKTDTKKFLVNGDAQK